MRTLLRRALVFATSAAVTALAVGWWLHEGDLSAAAEEGLSVFGAWDADTLANNAGVPADEPAPVSPAEPASPPAADPD